MIALTLPTPNATFVNNFSFAGTYRSVRTIVLWISNGNHKTINDRTIQRHAYVAFNVFFSFFVSVVAMLFCKIATACLLAMTYTWIFEMVSTTVAAPINIVMIIVRSYEVNTHNFMKSRNRPDNIQEKKMIIITLLVVIHRYL